MSGHSKWAGIKHKKAIIDSKRGKVFSKLAREFTVAARIGGSNPDHNPRLRVCFEKAREYNMPSDNVKRAIQKGTGELGGALMEDVIYEGYGLAGVAVFVEAMTDNKNRTTPEIRKIFSKWGGSMGESGCVAWMFNKKGCFSIDLNEISEDKLLDLVTEAGADDLKIEDDVYEIITEPSKFETVKKILEENKIKIKYAEISMIAQNYIKVDNKTARQVLNLVEQLEDHEDVQNVFANFDIPDEIMAELQ